jgi:putative transposase
MGALLPISSSGSLRRACPIRSGSAIPKPSKRQKEGSRLSVILHLFSRMVVGWAMAATEDGQLVERARLLALATRRPPTGLFHHSDRGSELTSERSQALLREAGFEVSRSRTGDCSDNAAMEAFFATLTKECSDRVRFQTRQEARSAIFEYLECFDNPLRLHST